MSHLEIKLGETQKDSSYYYFEHLFMLQKDNYVQW